MKYPLGYNSWNNEEIKAAHKTIDSGNYSMGENVKIFEKKFAKYFGSKYAVMVNSGSSANFLMFAVLKYFKKFLKKKTNKPNIIVPGIGWSTSYFPINQNDFELNFVDVDINTINIDIKKIEKCIDKNTVGILAINILGNPCNFRELKKICKKKNLVLLEDNCESMHSKINHQYSGTFGLMGTFSLYFSHHIQTIEGGMILTNNPEVYDILKSLRAHGWCRELNKSNSLFKLSDDKIKNLFTFITPGFNFRPMEIQAAVGIEQLKKQKNFNKIRKKNAEYFKKKFSNLKNFLIQTNENFSKPSYFAFNIILTSQLKNKRKKILKELKKNNIEARPTVAGNILNNPVKKFLNYKKKFSLKISDYIHNNGFFVGNYPKNLIREIDYLFDILSKYK